MISGATFLQSKIARRFCLLFIVCAFIPVIALTYVSYTKVVNQLEQQSYLRLKREAKSYGLSLFDRMIRIDNELQNIGRSGQADQDEVRVVLQQREDDLHVLFSTIALYRVATDEFITLYGTPDFLSQQLFSQPEQLTSEKPFISTLRPANDRVRIIFGRNINSPGNAPMTIVAEVNLEYLWGIGPSPVLPPMTQLLAYDMAGEQIIASLELSSTQYGDIHKEYVGGDLRAFGFQAGDKEYFASLTNLFIESRFQKTGWTIIICRAKEDVMSALDNFKNTFPFIILLFLLLILFLSFLFIRRALEPMEILKAGTKRVAQKDFSTLVEIQSDDEFEDLV